MAVTHQFPVQKLRALGFSIQRESMPPQILHTFDNNVANDNYFFLLENAKPQDCGFIEFEDESVHISRDDLVYALFGHENEDLYCISEGWKILKFFVEEDRFVFVNTNLKNFVRCFCRFQSVILGIRSDYLLGEAAMEDRKSGDSERYLSILEKNRDLLREFFVDIDSASVKQGTYWDSVLDEFGDDRIALLPRLGYYARKGRLKLGQQ